MSIGQPSICYVRIPSISKTDHCADRAILALPSGYREYLVTFKLTTSQVVQRERPLSGHIWLLGRQRVKQTTTTIDGNENDTKQKL